MSRVCFFFFCFVLFCFLEGSQPGKGTTAKRFLELYTNDAEAHSHRRYYCIIEILEQFGEKRDPRVNVEQSKVVVCRIGGYLKQSSLIITLVLHSHLDYAGPKVLMTMLVNFYGL